MALNIYMLKWQKQNKKKVNTNNNYPKLLIRMNTKAVELTINKINPETNKENISIAHTLSSSQI